VKPPAFQFYADDFLAGTMDLTPEEVGSYIRLLCHQWSKGHIPNDRERLARLSGGFISVYVLEKFEECADGNLRNARMEAERLKQDEYRKRQAENGKKGGRPKGSLTQAKPNPKPTENPTLLSGLSQTKAKKSSPSPSPSSRDKQTKGQPESMEHVEAYAACAKLPTDQVEPFFDYFSSNGWKVGGKAAMKDWKAAFRNWCRNAKTQPATKKQNGAMAQNGTVSASMRAVMIKDSLKRCESAISKIEDKYDYHRDPTPEERKQLKALQAERKQLEQQQRKLLEA
jgi:uncharacterized protein YdaU (DUF1376 family)